MACSAIHGPGHEVGRNADIFDDNTGRLLEAGSAIVSDSIHLHSNGRDTTGHLEIGFIFHDRDFEPKYRDSINFTGNGVDISIAPNQTDQELHATVFSKHILRLSLSNLICMPRGLACVWKQSGVIKSRHCLVQDTTITGCEPINLRILQRHYYPKVLFFILLVNE
ncbi:MAG: hypothetical protein Ct9H300mP22_5700 [Gammaproteobacteria bacterium]|nr:MAG: hypothetical protein Ct9H300mP22_5700 [Gammaproteobacteria bacterium]